MDKTNNPFTDWLVEINKEQISDSIIAFNFGIFEGENGYVVYLSGSSNYDPENDDWACNDDYIPNKKYLFLPPELSNKKWDEVEEQISRWLKEYLISPPAKTSFLNKAKAITVGFDGGDLSQIVVT